MSVAFDRFSRDWNQYQDTYTTATISKIPSQETTLRPGIRLVLWFQSTQHVCRRLQVADKLPGLVILNLYNVESPLIVFIVAPPFHPSCDATDSVHMYSEAS